MNKNFLIGCLAGGLAGLASALLCAPQSGSDLIHNTLNRSKNSGKRQRKTDLKSNESEDSSSSNENKNTPSYEKDDLLTEKEIQEMVTEFENENGSEGKKKGSKKKTNDSSEIKDDSFSHS